MAFGLIFLFQDFESVRALLLYLISCMIVDMNIQYPFESLFNTMSVEIMYSKVNVMSMCDETSHQHILSDTIAIIMADSKSAGETRPLQ